MKTNRIYTEKITTEASGLRLDKYLSQLEDISSRNYAKNLIDKGLVLINGKAVKASWPVNEGEELQIHFPEIEPSDLKPYNFKLDVVFEDADILVINKPAGLVVHPAAGHQQDTLVNALLYYTNQLSMKNEQRPGIVHRIDKDTSGLLVIAKNDFTHESLSLQFKNKTTHRIYYAVAQGKLKLQAGTCKSYLARHPSDRKKFASIRENNKIRTEFSGEIKGGKWAVSHFKKISESNDKSYLKIKLETGRTHQIRVHLSEMGYPLIGDILYGYPPKKMRDLGLTRFFLHAAELGFTHPRTGGKLMFSSSWPSGDLQKIIEFGFTYDQISK